jgi:hypothetical protein
MHQRFNILPIHIRMEYALILPCCIIADAELTRVGIFSCRGFCDGIFVQLFGNHRGIAGTGNNFLLSLGLRSTVQPEYSNCATDAARIPCSDIRKRKINY